MNISAFPKDQLHTLTADQMNRIVFMPQEETREPGIAAILLGGNPLVLAERARAAAQLYHQQLAAYIIPTGGVCWDTDRGRMSEAQYLQLLLAELGVPEKAILLENEATTTRENMLYASLLLEKQLRPRGSYRLYIVSSPSHVKRSLALGALYLPRNARLSVYFDSDSPGASQVWQKDEFQASRVFRELTEIKKTVDCGDMPDIVF